MAGCDGRHTSPGDQEDARNEAGNDDNHKLQTTQCLQTNQQHG